MRASIAILLWLSTSLAVAQNRVSWEFPNFSDRIDVVIKNPTGRGIDTLAVLNIADIRKIAPAFPGTLAVAVTSKQPAKFLPSQVDHLDDDDPRNEFVVAVKLAPHEKQSLNIYYSTTLHENIPGTKRVHASHSYGFNHATAALESELIGYRTYGGFFFDVQAHAQGQVGLFNSLIGFARISTPPIEGRDIVHLGDTLGLGGLFLRTGGSTFRPPMNTPDYTHRTAKPEEPVYRILSDGPLRAIVEASLQHWTVGTDEVSLRALYEIRSGEESVRCHWWITPLRISTGYEVGAGIRDLPGMHILEGKNLVVTSGTQEAAVGPIALGLSFAPAEAHRAGTLQTPDGGNQIIVFAQKFEPGNTIAGEYTFAAAWSGSGLIDTAAHLSTILQNEQTQPVVKLVSHETNPKPQQLEREPS